MGALKFWPMSGVNLAHFTFSASVTSTTILLLAAFCQFQRILLLSLPVPGDGMTSVPALLQWILLLPSQEVPESDFRGMQPLEIQWLVVQVRVRNIATSVSWDQPGCA